MSATAVDAPFVARAEGFRTVLGDDPRLIRVADVDAHEGPVYFADEDALYFTTLPRPRRDGAPLVQIKRLSLSDPSDVAVIVEDANAANGMTADRGGRLLICEQGGRADSARISRLDRASGERETVLDAWRSLPFNSPNDLVVAPDGAIWFTDPSYGHLQGFRPAPVVGDFVYRHDPVSGRTDVVADDFDKPNGIALSPDGHTLYMTDSGANQEPGSLYVDRPHHVIAFEVRDGARLADRRLFAVVTPGFPDGLKVDAAGRVYVSSSSGVQVFAADGQALGEIQVPGAVNFCFGGPHRNLLLITTDSAVFAAALAAKGA